MATKTGFSSGKVRQQREAPLDDKQADKESSARKSELKKKRSGDDGVLDITDQYIQDGDGNIEHHNVEVVHRRCNYIAGDYIPGHKNCDAPCSMRPLCCTNAVANNRITVNEGFLDRMKEEAAGLHKVEYEAVKKSGTLLVPTSDTDLGGVPAKKPFPLKPKKHAHKTKSTAII
jgi:hypothetical protein